LIWFSTIDGEEKTPYAGGWFHLKIQIPSDFPFRPPRINFITKIYHPGVRDFDGFLCSCYTDFILKDQ
jgi:ubiquitin-protein ligase